MYKRTDFRFEDTSAMAETQHEEASSKEQKVDPWTVHAAEGEATIDYDKLIGINSRIIYA